jgi:hypothetical protein
MRRSGLLVAALSGLVLTGGGVGVAAATVGTQQYTSAAVAQPSGQQAPSGAPSGSPTGIIGEDVPAKPEMPPGGETDCPTGPAQKQVETYLADAKIFGAVTVDGKQSAADCAAIVKFQKRYGIEPAMGYAGPLSARVATRLAAANYDGCDTGSGLTVCVDLTSQTAWVVNDGERILGPTTVRTGRDGKETATGNLQIEEKKRSTISSYFHVELPYWQQFHEDMGFHQTPSYLYDATPGSHGCINLLPSDAKKLFTLTSVGTPVHIFGRKPGT